MAPGGGYSHLCASFKKDTHPNDLQRAPLNRVCNTVYCIEVLTLVLALRHSRLIPNYSPEKASLFLGMLSACLFITVVIKTSYCLFRFIRRSSFLKKFQTPQYRKRKKKTKKEKNPQNPPHYHNNYGVFYSSDKKKKKGKCSGNSKQISCSSFCYPLLINRASFSCASVQCVVA